MQPNLNFDESFAGLAPSSTLYVNETVNRMWAEGKNVFHMGFGESRFDVHPKLKAALEANADKKSYLPAKGLLELRQAVSNYYSQKLGVEFNTEQTIIGPGSKALIYGLQMVLNTDVFLPSPSWVSYAPQAKLLGRRCWQIPATPDDDYQLDIEVLDQLIQQSGADCKLLVINSPNNPTGQMLSADYLQTLADYCREKGVWVLSDEIYFQVSHAGQNHVSMATYYPEGTFVLGGLSKHMSIGGWRLGVALLPATKQGIEIMQKLTIVASEIWSSVAAPIQYAAIQAYSLDSEIEAYVGDCCDIHRIRTHYFHTALTAMGIRCSRSTGGFYIMPNFDEFRDGLAELGIQTSNDLAKHLLSEYGIATLPGSDFGLPEKAQSLRLSTSYLDLETEFDAGRLLSLYRSGVGVKTLMSSQHHPQTNAAINAFEQFVTTIK